MKETLKKTLTLMLRAHILGTFKLNHAYNLGVVQASKMVLESMDMEERVVETLLNRASMWANDKCPGLRDVPKTCQPGCDDCTKWVNGAVATYLAGATNLPVPPLTEQLTFGVWYITQCPGRHCLKEDFRFDPGITHQKVKDIQAASLDDAYRRMQGYNWSPNGEARPLIESLEGVSHTSMSIGDVLRPHELGKMAFVALPSFSQDYWHWASPARVRELVRTDVL
jgi:hypothetical protein